MAAVTAVTWAACPMEGGLMGEALLPALEAATALIPAVITGKNYMRLRLEVAHHPRTSRNTQPAADTAPIQHCLLSAPAAQEKRCLTWPSAVAQHGKQGMEGAFHSCKKMLPFLPLGTL